jgi:type IX secretion system PorP/SprF family membrane protein
MRFVYQIVLTLGFIALWMPKAQAQLEPQSTYFMYNKLFYNPACAGSEQVPLIQVLYRKQWVGLEGAPTMGLFSWQKLILSDKVGVGTNLMYHSIGVHKRVHGDFAYSYNARLLNGYFYGGLQASFRYIQQNWADERLVATQAISLDPAVVPESVSKLIPNFGAGFYYTTDKYFVGMGIPRFVLNSVDLAEYGSKLSRESRHIYFMAGYNFEISKDVQLTTQFMGNYVKSQPFELDLNALATWSNKLVTGLTYRTGGDQNQFGESVDVLLGVYAREKLFISAGYDMTLTKLKKYSAGSVELGVRYYLRPPAKPNAIDKVEGTKPSSTDQG